MEKIMPLELLASIKGATSSKDVDALFGIIKKAVSEGKLSDGTEESGTSGAGSAGMSGTVVSPGDLREDVVAEATAMEKELIRKNFPGEKNGYLVVPRVIED
ncbi:MAG: hypothetical protein ACWGNV_04505 [Bacteroidales bacterium]